MENLILVLLLVIGLPGGIILGYFLRKFIAQKQIASAEAKAEKLLASAYSQKKEILLQAKDEALKIKEEAKREEKERLKKIEDLEQKLRKKEEIVDAKGISLERKETELLKRENQLKKTEEEITKLKQEADRKLEEIAGFSKDQAQEILLKKVEEEVKEDLAKKIKVLEEQAKEEAEKKAREIIATAIQRIAAEHTTETTISTVSLPSDEMKGRIIGREGRNIQAFEKVTGVDLIVDDTPEVVVISCFDPVRRAIAKRALEKLILDGRIQPARIEEMVKKAEKEIEAEIKEAGERAVFETGVKGLHPDLIKLLGRLKFRTSYGQNVLKHSIEVAHIAGILAAEIGADVEAIKKAALLHDIGKALDHEISGSHAQISRDIARKYGLDERIVHAIEAHHEEVEPQTKEAALLATIESLILQAADAISASRPGARRETLEAYIKRLAELENIANSFKGVEKAYAIQAGREIRVIVKPEDISDLEAVKLSRDIAAKIEKELEYPGQIKVNVIRETRAVEFAK